MTSAAPPLLAHSGISGSTRSWLHSLFAFPSMIVAALACLTFWTCVPRVDDPDLWWHLRIGQQIWKTHSIPVTDQLSFTASGHPWFAHEWLSEAILYGIYQSGGHAALVLWMCVIASAIVALSYLLCAQWSGNCKVSLVGGISTLFFLTSGLTIRPALLGYLFLSIELLLLHRLFTGKAGRWHWALPFVFLGWANCHGSFIFGLGILSALTFFVCVSRGSGAFSVTVYWDEVRRFSVLVGACWLAVFVNPIGPSAVIYPIGIVFALKDATTVIQEWAALDIHEPRAPAVAAIFAVIIVAALRRWTNIRILEWALLLLGAAMSVSHVRMLPIFGILSAPIVCRVLAPWWDQYDPRRDRPFLNAMLIAGFVCFSWYVLPKARTIEKQIESTEPVKAVIAMRRMDLPGPLINDYGWGGYLIWAYPEQKVFIDGRADIFAWTGVMREFGRWAQLEEDPTVLLNKYGISTCLVHSSAPVAQVLRHLPEWERVYDDGLAVVFHRPAATGAQVHN